MTPSKPSGKPSSPMTGAKAPYNFVQLPEKVLWSEAVLEQATYYADRHTGWMECTLTTESPLYVRCGLRADQLGKVATKDLPDFFYTDPDTLDPVIPGSSIRGMLRGLLEISGYGKVQPVTAASKMSYRAVAAPKSDPLSEPYQNILGRNGGLVKAGYLRRQGEEWRIQPARRPIDVGLSEKGAYVKVKDRQIPDGTITGLLRLNSDDYHPQYHPVDFDAEDAQGKKGKYTRVVKIGQKGAYPLRGTLVCTGNMAESGKAERTQRKNHALILEPNSKGRLVIIPQQVVQDYLNTLTGFQTEAPFDKHWGCLIEGRPVFYVEQGGQVVAFGHCPNFRIPAWLPGTQPKRAATPRDFVPQALHDPEQTDIAEAMFGYVETETQVGRRVSLAGRVSVTDAVLADGQTDWWFNTDAPVITPKILSSPKPTTFQHYLTQPMEQEQLHHYGSEPETETVIRGHKLYWHKPNLKQSDWAEVPEKQGIDDSQHTHIKPVRAGLQFCFHIHFENLSDAELGALLWLLQVAAEDGYRLKLGMGKPLGLGSIKIETRLHLTDRRARYSRLFQGSAWANGETDETVHDTWDRAVKAFEARILQDGALNPQGAETLREIPRIQMLLFLLSWPGPDKQQTRYLEIEHSENGNEYKGRPVLPMPAEVISGETRARPIGASPPVRKPATKPQPAAPGRQPAPSSTPATARVASPQPAAPQAITRPQHPDDIKVGIRLEATIVKIDQNSVKFDIGMEGVALSAGLPRLDSLLRTHAPIKRHYAGRPVPSALRLFQEGWLEDELCGQRMCVQVRKVETRHGKVLVNVDLIDWIEA